MKKFMDTCYKCKTQVAVATVVKEGIALQCLKCPKCNEEFFTSSELMKYDILRGKKSLIRKFGTLGDSTIVRLPEKVVKDFKIQPGDYGVFEKRSDGILIKPYHAKELNS